MRKIAALNFLLRGLRPSKHISEPALCPANAPRRPRAVFCATLENCYAKSGGIQIITIAVRDSSTDLGFLFSLNSTGLGFVTESFEEAELVTDAILGEIDIPCPP